MANDRDSYAGPLFTRHKPPVGYAVVGHGFHAPFQPHSRTSRAAARSLSPGWLGGARLQAWSAIRSQAATGCTDEEGCAISGLTPSSYRPRRVELVEAGLVEDSGATRPGQSGRQMTVWRAKG